MIRYIKQEIPRLHDRMKAQCYYRVESFGNMSHKDVVEQMARNGISKASAEMALRQTAEAIKELLLQGFSVTIDNIGCFSLALGMVADKTVEELDGSTKRNAKSIKIKSINLKTDKKLLNEMNQRCRLERGDTVRINRSRLTISQRLKKAQEYIARNKFMHIADYVNMTGVSRTTASLELREFAAHSNTTGITRSGFGAALIYHAYEPGQ
ncbi:MAG: HU family DNA-binding protein [Bacteroidaceae bacterium]|nr:HU family DNA-binding protein [Bacteroidaceae bacterium]